VELVESAPGPHDEAEWVDDVVVLETNSESQLMVARSLLESQGIPCFAQGEEGQQLFGAGPIRLRVRIGHEKAAREILARMPPIEPVEE
jgi:hypothetical protein